MVSASKSIVNKPESNTIRSKFKHTKIQQEIEAQKLQLITDHGQAMNTLKEKYATVKGANAFG
jgi:hypothetical protein